MADTPAAENNSAENAPADLPKPEALKANSRYLRGTLKAELANDAPDFSDDAASLLKFHGSYQQDDRDLRKAKNPDGTPRASTTS